MADFGPNFVDESLRSAQQRRPHTAAKNRRSKMKGPRSSSNSLAASSLPASNMLSFSSSRQSTPTLEFSVTSRLAAVEGRCTSSSTKPFETSENALDAGNKPPSPIFRRKRAKVRRKKPRLSGTPLSGGTNHDADAQSPVDHVQTEKTSTPAELVTPSRAPSTSHCRLSRNNSLSSSLGSSSPSSRSEESKQKVEPLTAANIRQRKPSSLPQKRSAPGATDSGSTSPVKRPARNHSKQSNHSHEVSSNAAAASASASSSGDKLMSDAGRAVDEADSPENSRRDDVVNPKENGQENIQLAVPEAGHHAAGKPSSLGMHAQASQLSECLDVADSIDLKTVCTQPPASPVLFQPEKDGDGRDAVTPSTNLETLPAGARPRTLTSPVVARDSPADSAQDEDSCTGTLLTWATPVKRQQSRLERTVGAWKPLPSSDQKMRFLGSLQFRRTVDELLFVGNHLVCRLGSQLITWLHESGSDAGSLDFRIGAHITCSEPVSCSCAISTTHLAVVSIASTVRIYNVSDLNLDHHLDQSAGPFSQDVATQSQSIEQSASSTSRAVTAAAYGDLILAVLSWSRSYRAELSCWTNPLEKRSHHFELDGFTAMKAAISLEFLDEKHLVATTPSHIHLWDLSRAGSPLVSVAFATIVPSTLCSHNRLDIWGHHKANSGGFLLILGSIGSATFCDGKEAVGHVLRLSKPNKHDQEPTDDAVANSWSHVVTLPGQAVVDGTFRYPLMVVGRQETDHTELITWNIKTAQWLSCLELPHHHRDQQAQNSANDGDGPSKRLCVSRTGPPLVAWLEKDAKCVSIAYQF